MGNFTQWSPLSIICIQNVTKHSDILLYRSYLFIDIYSGCNIFAELRYHILRTSRRIRQL